MLPVQHEALTEADSDVARGFDADSCVELAYSGKVKKKIDDVLWIPQAGSQPFTLVCSTKHVLAASEIIKLWF